LLLESRTKEVVGKAFFFRVRSVIAGSVVSGEARFSVRMNDPGEGHLAQLPGFQPDLNLLAIEKVEGRGRVSFEHVVKPRTEISLTYFGNVLVAKLVSITDVVEAKEKHPILMRPTAESELEDMIQLDDTYTLEEVVAGYKTTKLVNIHFKNFLEEETERLLDDNGFVFSDDGESYSVFCMYCECTPCVWTFNEQMIIDYDKATHDEETAQNTRRHAVYRQMALYINGGPSGSGNRLKLPICVLTGVRNLFPDPDAKYTGHRDLE
jgi:hypothetical protein